MPIPLRQFQKGPRFGERDREADGRDVAGNRFVALLRAQAVSAKPLPKRLPETRQRFLGIAADEQRAVAGRDAAEANAEGAARGQCAANALYVSAARFARRLLQAGAAGSRLWKVFRLMEETGRKMKLSKGV